MLSQFNKKLGHNNAGISSKISKNENTKHYSALKYGT